MELDSRKVFEAYLKFLLARISIVTFVKISVTTTQITENKTVLALNLITYNNKGKTLKMQLFFYIIYKKST